MPRNDAITYVTCSSISRHSELFYQNRLQKLFQSVKGSGNSAFLQKDELCYLKRAEKLTFCIYFL